MKSFDGYSSSATFHHAEKLSFNGGANDFAVMEPRADLMLESPPPFKHALDTAGLMNRPTRVLGTFSVMTITFLFGCGGPLGSEPIVSIAGPVVALVGFLVYPIVYTVPYAGVVSELSAAFPEDGGFTIWILNAFGPFWSVQVGYWSWIAGALSIAIYPSYILDTVARAADIDVPDSYFIKAAITVVLCVPALVGTRCISRLTTVLLATVLLPIMVFVCWSFIRFDVSAAEQLGAIRRENIVINDTTGLVMTTGAVDIDRFEFVNTLYWNYEGLRMASVFGGQVLNPSVVYSRAIWYVVALTVAVYTLPLLATMISGSQSWSLFDSGTYEAAADVIGGEPLRVIMIMCSVATCLGLHICGVFCVSTEISGMAESKLLPTVIAIRNAPCGSPHYAILASLLATLGFLAFDIDELLPVANTFGSLVAASIFLSAIEIRRSMPFMSRPVRVPGGVWMLVVIAIFPVSLCGYIIVRTLISSLSSALLVLGFLAPAIAYGAYRAYRFKSILFR